MASYMQFTVTPAGQATVSACALTGSLAARLRDMGEDVSALNRITWRSGASKFSEAMVILRRDVVQQMLASDATRPAVITMGDVSRPDHFIKCQWMYLLEPRPIHVLQTSGGFDALYACRFVDARYFWQGVSSELAYNITTTADRTAYYTQSEDSGPSAFTWAQLISALLTDLGISADVVSSLDTIAYGTPNDYLINNEPAGEMLDRVLAIFGAVLTAYPNDTAGGGKKYRIDLANAYNSYALSTNDSFLTERFGGGVTYAQDAEGTVLKNAIMPSSVTVNFPRQIPTTATDSAASANPPPMRQQKTITSTAGKPVGSTGRSGYTVIVNDALWAIGSIGTETNLTALQARADAIAGSYYNSWKAVSLSTRHAGVVNPLPVAGTVEWHHTESGVYTDVHNLRCVFTWENEEVRIYGLGGIQTWKTYDGSIVISTNSGLGANGSEFPVIVKANGTDGTNSKYDVYSQIDTGYVTKLNLAGALVPKCSRARWQASVPVIAASDGSIADAYFDTSGAIQLFDLQETICIVDGGTIYQAA